MADGRPLVVKYFAWVRERVGVAEERLEVPAGVVTVGDLVGWIAAIDDAHGYALDQAATIRVAVDQMHADHDLPLGTPREVALFPPMTGG